MGSKRRVRCWLAVAVAAIVVSACGGDGTGPDRLVRESAAPATTDGSAVSTVDSPTTSSSEPATTAPPVTEPPTTTAPPPPPPPTVAAAAVAPPVPVTAPREPVRLQPADPQRVVGDI